MLQWQQKFEQYQATLSVEDTHSVAHLRLQVAKLTVIL